MGIGQPNIKDVKTIELDMQTFTVKCKTATGYVLWETRRTTLQDAQAIQMYIAKKQLEYIKSVSRP